MSRQPAQTLPLKYVSWLTISLFALIGVFTFADYGITWDEFVHATYGDLVLDYYQSLFTDQRCLHYMDLYLYGALFEIITTLGHRLSGWDIYLVRHFFVGVCAVLTLLAIYKYTRLFSDPLLPIFALFALLMLPRFFGHSFNNAKDIPFACAFSWSMWAIAKLYLANNKGWRPFVICGLTIGVALSARIGGFLLFLFVAMAMGAALWRTYKSEGQTLRPKVIHWVTGSLVSAVLAWCTMLCFWPWLHQSPLWQPLRALSAATAFPNAYPVLFEGVVHKSSELPLSYLPKFLWLTTPPIIVILLGCGLLAMALRWRRNNNRKNPDNFLALLTVLWFLIPIVFVLFKRSNIYDGIRHFLFILPALAVIAGLGACWVTHRLSPLSRQRWLATTLVATLLLSPVANHLQLHPYQSSYFNIMAGGLKKAWQQYETDYWVSSYKEAAEWINLQAQAHPEREWTVVLAANEYNRTCAEHYLHPSITVHPYFLPSDPLPARFDFYIATTRYDLFQRLPHLPVVHTIGRQGGIFCVIKAGPNLPQAGQQNPTSAHSQ